MFRQFVTPKNTQLTLQIPDEFVGHRVEIIAFIDDNQTLEEGSNAKTYSFENALEFFKKNAVDFSKIEKWKREDLYE